MLLAGAAFVASYLPFVGKAFHIDDPGFIRLSRQVGWNPLRSTTADYYYEGALLAEHLPYEVPHPLLVPYVIKILASLFGENEVELHLAFLVFPAIALLSLWRLNETLFPRLPGRAWLTVLIFGAMPAFLVNAQTVMADVPTVAFLLLGMAGYFSGIESGRASRLWLGGLGLTLAVFSSYQALAVIPLLFLHAAWRRRLDLRVALVLAAPVALMAAWLLAVYVLYGVFPVLKSRLPGTPVDAARLIAQGLDIQVILAKTFAALGLIGAAMAWVTPLHHALKGSWITFLLLFLPLLLLSDLALSRMTDYAFAPNAFLSVFVALGIVTLLTLAWSVWTRRRDGRVAEEVFLLMWVLCVLGYTIVLLPFSAARYLLPLFPAALLLLVNDPAWRFTTRVRRAGLAVVLGGALLFGLASAYSDYQLAGAYRKFAALVASQPRGGQVWYVGEWGMRYYLDRVGARYLLVDSTAPATGDLVVIPEMPRLWIPSPQVRSRMAFATEVPYRSPLPLRLFNLASHAGFYAHAWGLLPFAISDEPDEVFQVFRIVR